MNTAPFIKIAAGVAMMLLTARLGGPLGNGLMLAGGVVVGLGVSDLL